MADKDRAKSQIRGKHRLTVKFGHGARTTEPGLSNDSYPKAGPTRTTDPGLSNDSSGRWVQGIVQSGGIQVCLNENRNGERIKRADQESGSRERIEGIEPSSEAWEAPALPLSYTRTIFRQYVLYVFDNLGTLLNRIPPTSIDINCFLGLIKIPL